MANLQVWQNRITEYNRQITEINTEITTIDSQTPVDSVIITMLATRKASLQDKLNNLNRMLGVFQAKFDEESLAASYSFTPDQQVIVNTLNITFAKQMGELLKMTPEKKTEFFTLYAKGGNCTECDCVVRCFFDL